MELAQTSCFHATEAVEGCWVGYQMTVEEIPAAHCKRVRVPLGIYSYLMHSRIPSPGCPLLQPCWRFKSVKFESFPKEVGIWPEKLLYDKSIICSPGALPREAGMGSSNELFCKVSWMRFGRSSPMLGGSDALSSILWSRLRDIREERLNMEAGI